MGADRALSISVILGTVRKGRMSANCAHFVAGELAKFPGVETEVIDISKLPLPVDDAGEAIKDAGIALAAETMIPEAFRNGPRYSGVLAASGFAALILLSEVAK